MQRDGGGMGDQIRMTPEVEKWLAGVRDAHLRKPLRRQRNAGGHDRTSKPIIRALFLDH